MDADPSELEQAGKEIMKSTPPPSSKKQEKPIVKSKPKKKEKNKMVYLDESVHKEARIKASMTGKTIKQFITDLIKSFEL